MKKLLLLVMLILLLPIVFADYEINLTAQSKATYPLNDSRYNVTNSIGNIANASLNGTGYGKVNYPGTISGATYVDGKYGNGLLFDGTNDYTDIGTGFTSPTGSATYSLWVYPNELKTSHYMISKLGNTAGDFSLYMEDGSGHLSFRRWTGVSNNYNRWLTVSGTVQINQWNHILIIYNSTSQNSDIYINGVKSTISTFTSTSTQGVNSLYIGRASTAYFNGTIDSVLIFDTALNSTQVADLYANRYPASNRNLTAAYYMDDNSSATVLVDNNHLTAGPLGNNGNAAIGFDGVDDQINETTTTNFIFNYTTPFTFSAWYKINGLPPSSYRMGIVAKSAKYGIDIYDTGAVRFGVRQDSTTVSSTYLPTNPINTWHHATGVYDNNTRYISLYVDGNLVDSDDVSSVNFLSTATLLKIGAGYVNGNAVTFNGSIADVRVFDRSLSDAEIRILADRNNALLNITAYSIDGSATINNFNATITQGLTSETVSTTSGNLLYAVNVSLPYTVAVKAAGYEYKTYEQTYSSDYYLLNATLHTRNSINISISELETGTKITELTTLIYTGPTAQNSTTTTSGNIYLTNLTAGSYNLRFISANYTSAIYPITIVDNAYTTLNAYLLKTSSGDVIFTYIDADTSAAIEDATVAVSTYVNNSLINVSYFYTDITGRIKFAYKDDYSYVFQAVKSGYAPRQFTLDPVIYESYTVKMYSLADSGSNQDFSTISINWTPTRWYANAQNNVTFVFLNPDSDFTQYGFNVTNNGVTQSAAGSTAGGNTLSLNYTLGSTAAFDRVRIDYYYQREGESIKTFTTYYDITANTGRGFVQRLGDRQGMGLFERVLIVTLVVMFVAGAAFMFVGPTAGGAMALIMFGLFIYVGFLEVWAAVISMIVLFVLVAWRSSFS